MEQNNIKETNTDAVITSLFVGAIFGIVIGVFIGLASYDVKTPQQDICKQLYTNTTGYINCNAVNSINDVISRIQPIK